MPFFTSWKQNFTWALVLTVEQTVTEKDEVARANLWKGMWPKLKKTKLTPLREIFWSIPSLRSSRPGRTSSQSPSRCWRESILWNLSFNNILSKQFLGPHNQTTNRYQLWHGPNCVPHPLFDGVIGMLSCFTDNPQSIGCVVKVWRGGRQVPQVVF